MPQRHELRLPDLGFAASRVTLSLWLVEPGCEVSRGDRLVELLAGAATVDLPAPVSGVFLQALAHEKQELQTGQLLGVLLADEPD